MSSDGPVDVEKGATDEVVKKAAATKNRMTMAHMIFVDVVAVLEVLFTIGMMTWMISRSRKWWTPLPAVAVLLLLVGFTLSFKPKTNYAMEAVEPTAASDKDDDLSNKLLVAEK